MLFLTYAADGSASHAAPHVPVDDGSALCFERALLADGEATLRELQGTFSLDAKLASWAIQRAEVASGRTVNRVDDAVRWLSEHLVAELACSLVEDGNAAPHDGVAHRLPALVKKLIECERRLADFDNRLEQEKLDAMKELAYGASHEINNPLANIAARAQTLLDDEQDPQRRQKLVAIHRQAMRAHEMISDLMLFARPPKMKPASVDLPCLVREVVEQLTPLAREHSVQVEFDPTAAPIEIIADRAQIGVAIHAIVKNAIEAVSEGGCVTTELRKVANGDGSWAEIVVTDDGPGISDEVRRHMFDPFFSGREAGRGLGFGLSKCWRIVTDHGGRIIVEQSPRGGAEISICLPLPIAVADVQQLRC